MMLYRNTKVKVRYPDRDIDYFDIVAGVQQEDTLVSNLFIICLYYVLRTSICYILTLAPAQKYYSKVIHRKEVTHSNGQ